MTMTRTARFTAVAGALLLSTLLAACGPGIPTPTESPTAAPTLTPVPLPVATTAGGEVLGEQPAARTDATCDQLAPPATWNPVFGTDMSLVGPERTPERLGTVIVDAWVARQDGGVACEWQAAGAGVGSEGYGGSEVVRLQLIPATDAEWEPYSVTNGGGSRSSECGGGSYMCSLDIHIDGWWLAIWANNVPDSEASATLALFEEIVSRVVDLADPAPAGPSESGDAIPAACDEQLTQAQVQAVVGSAVTLADDYSQPSLSTTASRAVGLTNCVWSNALGGGPTVTVLPGGAWAMAIAVAAYGEAEATDIPGLPGGGWLRPQLEATGLDFALDGDWVMITVGSGDDRIAEALAAQFVANAS